MIKIENVDGINSKEDAKNGVIFGSIASLSTEVNTCTVNQ